MVGGGRLLVFQSSGLDNSNGMRKMPGEYEKRPRAQLADGENSGGISTIPFAYAAALSMLRQACPAVR